MNIYDLKINNKKRPIGFNLDNLRLSWKVAAGSLEVIETTVVVAIDQKFEKVVYKESGNLNSHAHKINIELAAKTRYYVRVYTLLNDNQQLASGIEYFETGLPKDQWQAAWITTDIKHEFHPTFFTNFKTEQQIQSAKLYISGLGLYNVRINDQQITDEVLTPYYSNYNYEVQYQTFDVTSGLTTDNLIEVDLGNGWYKGNFGLQHKNENFGNQFKLIAQLEITTVDGNTTIIKTDESWQYKESKYDLTDIYDGEIIDFTKECTQLYGAELTTVSAPLVDRFSLPVKEMEELKVKEIITTKKGETVLDFGQNFSGYIKIRDKQPKGTKVTVDFGEILQEGNFYNDNYRSAKSQYIYTSNGSEQWVKPMFTFFGFRYARISGFKTKAEIDDFIGCALYSEMDVTGNITTGNENVNKLFSNTMWGQKSNSIDFPTDCPQRDERLGWTGDVMAFAGTATLNMDVMAFYDKFLTDLRTEQIELDGILPGVIPVFNKEQAVFSSVWGDIATFLPIKLYETYGDIAILEKYLPMMEDWVDKVTREDIKRGQQFLFNYNHQIGDWLAINGRTEQSNQGETDIHFIASCYYAESVKKLIAAYKYLGQDSKIEQYHSLHKNILKAIYQEYFTTSGRLAVDTQTAYYVCLSFGIYPNREKLEEGLKARLYNDCYKITGGFVGAPMMCKTLADNGFEEEALYVLLQEDYPGWMHCINLGATTIWERWNSVLDNGIMSGTMMNSLNHYAFGGVIEYVYTNLAGLKQLETGYRKCLIEPKITNALGFVDVEYDSISGMWKSATKINDDGSITISVTVPTGCSAELKLPYSDRESIELSSGEFTTTYIPDKDVLAKYTEKTLFNDLIKDPTVMQIIDEECPILGFFLNVVGDEYLYDNLATISNMSYMGIDPQQVKKAEKRILAIKGE